MLLLVEVVVETGGPRWWRRWRWWRSWSIYHRNYTISGAHPVSTTVQDWWLEAVGGFARNAINGGDARGTNGGPSYFSTRCHSSMDYMQEQVDLDQDMPHGQANIAWYLCNRCWNCKRP